jgi:hypothetical protein
VLQSSLEVRLQLMISRAGDVRAGLLFKRLEGFPESLVIKVRGKDIGLSAYSDGWYTTDLEEQSWVAEILKEGLIASVHVSGTARTSWMLSAGREIYITSPQPGLGGYNSAPRLVLGRTQFLLVREHLQDHAIEILAETCGNFVRRFAQDHAPLPGWAVLGPVLPIKPLKLLDGEEHMNVIRPLPEIAILLEGGLCLRGAEWLEGFPPRISVVGPIPDGEQVFIDAVPASMDGNGVYVASASDSVGDHSVWCAGISRNYKISPAPKLSEPWRAHIGRKGTVCGAVSDYRNDNPKAHLVTVPCSNNILIGPEPGQLHAGTGQTGEWTGIVPFTPVWALPANPFQCSKNLARIMLLNPIPISRGIDNHQKLREVRSWYRAILDCKRKGLNLESSGAMALWDAYVRAARSARRSVG